MPRGGYGKVSMRLRLLSAKDTDVAARHTFFFGLRGCMYMRGPFFIWQDYVGSGCRFFFVFFL